MTTPAPSFSVIKTREMRELVETYHYSGRLNTNEIVSYGIRRDDGTLSAAALISPSMFNDPKTLALGRLAAAPDCAVKMSTFVGWCCRDLATRGYLLIVSFADSTVGHHGGLYQSCGWNFDGLRDASNDGLIIDGAFVPARTVVIRYGTRSIEKLGELAALLGTIPKGMSESDARAYIIKRGFSPPRDGTLKAVHKIKPTSTIAPHFDTGKYLYWRSLHVSAGHKLAKRLGLKSLPYPKPVAACGRDG